MTPTNRQLDHASHRGTARLAERQARERQAARMTAATGDVNQARVMPIAVGRVATRERR